MAHRARLRVGTYNVHGFSDAGFRMTLAAQAALIAESGVDVLGVQEVYAIRTSVGVSDGAAVLARLCGLPYCVESPVSTCGNAVLSRWPIVWHETLQLTLFRGRHARFAIAVAVRPPCGGDLVLLVTHLDHVEEPARALQWEGMQRWVSQHALLSHAPHVVVGDFNALCQGDYTAADWRHICEVRHRAGRRKATSLLMAAVLGLPCDRDEASERELAGQEDATPPRARPAPAAPAATASGPAATTRAASAGAAAAAAEAPPRACARPPVRPVFTATYADALRHAAPGPDPEGLGARWSAQATCRFGTRVDWILLQGGAAVADGDGSSTPASTTLRSAPPSRPSSRRRRNSFAGTTDTPVAEPEVVATTVALGAPRDDALQAALEELGYAPPAPPDAGAGEEVTVSPGRWRFARASYAVRASPASDHSLVTVDLECADGEAGDDDGPLPRISLAPLGAAAMQV